MDALVELAVFLDLPNPWEVIQSVKESLKVCNYSTILLYPRELMLCEHVQVTGGKFCSFSPCIEQVQRTCFQLNEFGFVDIQVMECLQRNYDIKSHILTVPNVGFPSASSEGSGEGAYSGKKLIHPSLSQHSLYTAQLSRKCPGHTGYLTFATLYPLDFLES